MKIWIGWKIQKENKRMKFVKKIVACMLVLLLFSSSVMLYVEAAEAAKEIENQSSRTQV